MSSIRSIRYAFATVILLFAPSSNVNAEEKSIRAAWMEGQWGIRVLLPGGDSQGVKSFEVEAFMAQIAQLDTISWVMLNITHGACGSLYTAPNPELEKHVHPAMTPSRDLLGEVITELKKKDIRVLVYFAAEGPAKVKSWSHPLEKTVLGSFEKWDAYTRELNMSSQEAIAEKIIKYYSLRYGDAIDGWWFDHARYGDTKLYAEAARAGNANAVVSYNMGHTGKVARGAREEDVAFGHPTPMAKQPPSWDGHVSMIETIENGPYIDGVLGHIFMPMQNMWWGKEPAFSTEKAMEWTKRVMRAGGAYTWAVALKAPHTRSSVLAEHQFMQLLEINREVKEMKIVNE